MQTWRDHGPGLSAAPAPPAASTHGRLPAVWRSVLEMVAGGAALEETLTAIVASVEAHVPGSRCAIIGCDDTTVAEVVVAPTLPSAWWRRVIAQRRPGSGSALVQIDKLCAPGIVAAAMEGAAGAGGVESPSRPATCASYPLHVDGGVAGAMAVYGTQQTISDELMRDYAQLAAVALSRLRAEHRLPQRLSMDDVTGLPSSHNAQSRIDAALERRRLGFGAFVAVICLELSRLAEYNATFGRLAGDQILRHVSAALTRHADAMMTVLRAGGGKFLLIAEGAMDVGDIVNIAHRVAHAAAGPVVAAGVPIVVDAAVGVAVAADGDTSATQLLAEAEAATVQARRSRLDKVAVFDPAVAQQASDRLIVELGLQRALAHEELTVHYQPIHAITDGRMVAAEALLRWRDPENGLRPPADFVPIAEDSGLIRRVTRWVLGQACQQIAQWERELPGEAVSVSVNVSATELHDPALVVDVRDAVLAAGIRPELLCLELTETAVMDDPEAALEVLATLKGIGVRLAIDDFGTGYSSLAYLRELPIDYVKIDRSFIAAMLRSPEDEAIVAAVIDLMTTLGLPVIAEGVETPGHVAALQRMRCRYAQGFHWSPAVPHDDFAAMRAAPEPPAAGR